MRRIIPLLAAAITSIAQAQTTNSAASMGSMDHLNMDHAAHMSTTPMQRQAQVSERSRYVMPFSLAATLHIFTKNSEGGVQQVVVRNKTDAEQVDLIRQHLQTIRAQFLQGDFSAPSHIHGVKMPGLAELKAAKPGDLTVDYKAIKGGAQLTYRTTDPLLVVALHKWFDAQVSDHGKDAQEGHQH